MIVPMKKAAIIVQSKDARSAVSKLRTLGIMHVEYSTAPAGRDIAGLKEEINTVTSAISILENPAYKKMSSGQPAAQVDWKFSAKHIVGQGRRLEQLTAYSRALTAQIDDWERWGDFDPQEIERLRAKGIFIRFFQAPVKALKNIPSTAVVKEVFRQAGAVYFLAISRGIEPGLPFKQIPAPKMGLEKMRARAYEDERLKELIVEDMIRQISYLQGLKASEEELKSQLELCEALEGMGKQGGISYLTGYVPYDRAADLEKTARQEQWGLSVRELSSEDSPPVLLRNPRWIRLIEPVMRMLGVRPGYNEIDVSPVFLVFFGIFFGILIGDAGYGLVYLLLAFWFGKIMGMERKNANIFYLSYVLSACAIAWGILTGTFFGHAWLVARGFVPLVPQLNDPVIMQRFCFFIGALHLSIAHGWRALLKLPHVSFLADAGWIAVLWPAFYLAGALILGTEFPDFCLPLATSGIILILFFSEPRKNPLKALGAGFTSVTFGLGFMSAFTDVVSYVRLFAVGLAAVAIADTFNNMGAGLGTGIIGIVAGAMVIALGHILNIVLGPIAILVHGVRLNLLEFGLNHTGLTWSGVPYKPLKE